MNGIIVVVINIAVLLKLKQVESVNEEGGQEQPKHYLSKEEVMEMLQDSVRSLIEADGSDSNDDQKLLRYFTMVKSLGYCMAGGEMKKHELVTCLNTVIGELGITPPAPFMKCLGEYIMCSSRVCFSSVLEKKADSETSKRRTSPTKIQRSVKRGNICKILFSVYTISKLCSHSQIRTT
ncbi:conserved hypothetical protein [Theileria orientalis strain Shintoku]|uniref:Uncharacterized protein n=1 Tax=Theileria orientalis strain Shintoku TaxID=869250 RepID=J4C7P6_THEOR|nr:conserved hypothetical protein [Theileria orientalis strain Shintoku]BAM39403.1 conserved hypothetical protein [Theileria orientalis strain Shintoku]|eukprot:XP_009689704.1 conserved hypothetical protein [Theileria orientalis strain Shintoku]